MTFDPSAYSPGSLVLVTRGGGAKLGTVGSTRQVLGRVLSPTEGVHPTGCAVMLLADDPLSADPGVSRKGDTGNWSKSALEPIAEWEARRWLADYSAAMREPTK